MLLNLNFCTSFFEGFLQGFSFFLGDAFFHGLRSTVNKFFGLLQTQASQIFNGFHDAKFLSSIGYTFQDDVKRGLLLSGSSATGSGSSSNSNSSCCGFNAVFFFQNVSKFFYFFNG